MTDILVICLIVFLSILGFPIFVLTISLIICSLADIIMGSFEMCHNIFKWIRRNNGLKRDKTKIKK